MDLEVFIWTSNTLTLAVGFCESFSSFEQSISAVMIVNSTAPRESRDSVCYSIIRCRLCLANQIPYFLGCAMVFLYHEEFIYNLNSHLLRPIVTN